MDAYDAEGGARHGPDPEPALAPRPGAAAGHGSGPESAPVLRPGAAAGHGPESAPAPRPGRAAEHGPDPESAPAPRPRVAAGHGPGPEPALAPRTGVAALSLRYQIGAAFALAVVAIAVCVHIGMVFLHVAPPNTVTKQHGKAIDDWIYPEFEQNWKLFAPNPLQQNIAVQVRADVREADGDLRTTGWYDLSAQDGRDIDGNLLPSHTQQNELRRAWDFLVATHDSDNRPVGLRGSLSQDYLRRIVVLRLQREEAAGPGGVLDRVQVRSRTLNVAPPEWSGEKVSDQPVYRVLPWWPVPAAEAGGEQR
ncbi:DUF5819 family protein [Streptomyces sp. CC219B]|uniref:DUF5819 family protein n=1 Tax=Streptomyces sp. CC219B TaxID=3044574 RepID=UPI0024A8825D|nr:DUF5819 family protein [Streptomyces sp. CC219B]